MKTRSENEVNQMKSYHKQQEEIAHIKKFIASVRPHTHTGPDQANSSL